ncbi:MAG TPA: hypothetical protein VK476_00295 [Flavobacterium sp.]|nr:hypothetical protein [Flavobacterium sp.]
MKKILYLCTLLVFAVSCSSDDADQTPTPALQVGILLKKTIQTTEFDTYTCNFTYNGNKLISISRTDFTTKFFYTGALITREDTFDSFGHLIIRINFSYDALGRLEVVKRATIGQGQGFKIIYQYKGDNTIIMSNYSGGETVQDELDSIDIGIIGDNYEIESVDTYSTSGVLTQTTNYEYDTKNNPYHNITGFDKLQLVYQGKSFNITSENWTEGINSGSQTNSYIYNDDDFPVLVTEAYNGVQNSETQYFYE